MSQWSEKIKNHHVWVLLQDLGPIIDAAFSIEGIDSETIDSLARLKSILSFIGRRIAGSDSFLFQAGVFDNLASSLQSMIQEVQSYIANGNAGHIANANANGDTALTYLAQLNVQLTTEEFIAAKESAESYRLGINKALKGVTGAASQLKGELDTLQTRTTEISTELTAERNRLTTIATDFQAQFSTAQELRITTFANDQKERQDGFTTVIAEYSQKLGEQDAGFTKQRADIAKQHEGDLAGLNKQFVDDATKLLGEINDRKFEVEKLVGVIGNLAVTSGYLTTANDAKKSVRMWQIITVGAMLLLIEIAYIAFLPAIEKGFNWPSFAGRVFVALTVGALAAYAGTQADKYLKIERYNRRMALELEALGPFIAPLATQEQTDFRIKVGERSFGQGERTHSDLDAKSPTNVADILADPKLRTFITDIIKAVKP
jgi:hypothetical protein